MKEMEQEEKRGEEKGRESKKRLDLERCFLISTLIVFTTLL
jgi:hypothetical protein